MVLTLCVWRDSGDSFKISKDITQQFAFVAIILGFSKLLCQSWTCATKMDVDLPKMTESGVVVRASASQSVD